MTRWESVDPKGKTLNRGDHEKIQGKVNNQDLRSGNYSRIQTQFPEADLGCFSAKL